jgi:hypothetical protein
MASHQGIAFEHTKQPHACLGGACCRFVPVLRSDGLDTVLGIFKALYIMGGGCTGTMGLPRTKTFMLPSR